MRTVAVLLIVLGISMPVAASAQSATQADQAYCDALRNTYLRYVGHSEDSHRGEFEGGSLDAQVAVTQCHGGNTADAISVLERELKNQGFDLPKRG